MATADPSSLPQQQQQQLAEATDLLKRGRKLMFDDPDAAVELLQQALKLHAEAGTDNKATAAPVYLAYVMALVGPPPRPII